MLSSDPKYMITFSGTPCPDWSTLGERAGSKGCAPTLVAFFTWAVLMNKIRPRLVAHENVDGFMMGLMILTMSHNYQIECIKMNPCDVSCFHANRHRSYCTMALRETMKSEYPLSMLKEVMKPDSHTAVATFNDFFFATISPEFKFVFSAFDKRNKATYDEHYPDKKIRDYGQDAKYSARYESVDGCLPALTTRSRRLVHVDRERWMLGCEKFLCMGLPVAQWASEETHFCCSRCCYPCNIYVYKYTYIQ